MPGTLWDQTRRRRGARLNRHGNALPAVRLPKSFMPRSTPIAATPLWVAVKRGPRVGCHDSRNLLEKNKRKKARDWLLRDSHRQVIDKDDGRMTKSRSRKTSSLKPRRLSLHHSAPHHSAPIISLRSFGWNRWAGFPVEMPGPFFLTPLPPRHVRRACGPTRQFQWSAAQGEVRAVGHSA